MLPSCRLSVFVLGMFVLPSLTTVNAQLENPYGQSQLWFSDCRSATLKHMVVFGDSFSDNGNVFKLSKGSWPDPMFFPKGRFTNGPNWADYVSHDRNLNMTNFGYGGATTDSKMVQGYSGRQYEYPVPGFMQQIDTYKDRMTRRPRDDLKVPKLDSTLFVINFQGNDFFFDPSIDSKIVVANVERGVHRLVQEVGARHLVIVENSDLSMIPYFQGNQTVVEKMRALTIKQHGEYQDLSKRLTKQYGRVRSAKGDHGAGQRTMFQNCMSSSSLGTEAGSKKVSIVFFDLYALYQRLKDPRYLQYLGITEVAHGCVNEDTTKRCRYPERHFFYDSFHSATKIHREVADGFLELL
ncbi:hypothetical protein EDD11_005231 [Mortierella claussenii]|nr:hypothetical protein EDD11_005231 [Mortierella claussenii]